jgi:hypothetical protein
MTATVTPIRQAVTWDNVRERHDRALQMAEQTVEVFAEIGDMLIALKAETDHGKFVERCAAAFSKRDSLSPFSDAQLEAAKRRASKYMGLASNRAAWQPKHPKSLNDALKMLPKKERKEKPYRESWTDVLLRHGVIDPVTLRGGSHVAVGKRIEKAGIELPEGRFFIDESAAENFAQDYVRAFPPEKPATRNLSKSDQKQVDKAIAIETERLRGLFMQELYAEVSRRTPEITAERLKEIEENREETRRYRILNATTKKILTSDEYRFLIQLLHPDRAPDDRKEQFSRAFQIVMKLKLYAEA